MIQIHLQPDIEAQLAAEARAQGIGLERYIVEKLSQISAAGQGTRPSPAEVIDRIRFLRKGNRLDGLKISDLIHEGRKH